MQGRIQFADQNSLKLGSCSTRPSASVHCWQGAAVLNSRGCLGFVPLSAKHTSHVERDLPIVTILSQVSSPNVPHRPQLLQRNPVQRYKEYHFEGRQNWLKTVADPMRELSRLRPLEPPYTNCFHDLLWMPDCLIPLKMQGYKGVQQTGCGRAAQLSLAGFCLRRNCLLHEAYICPNCQPHCQYIG